MENQSISKQTLKRLPIYLNYLKSYAQSGAENISATFIADSLGLNHVQVRKDLASVSSGGRPKTGYVTVDLMADIERFLGYDNTDSAVIVGYGKLGRALMSYEGFENYGLDIVAAFDKDEKVLEEKVFPISKLQDLCRRLKVRIGIITVPASAAQGVCNLLVESGILAIWNFAPVHLQVPEGILVQNENMASSLAVLSKHLSESFAIE